MLLKISNANDAAGVTNPPQPFVDLVAHSFGGLLSRTYLENQAILATPLSYRMDGPSGINCGTTCSALYDAGTTVTLTANPSSGYTLAGWSGACTNTTGPCVIKIDGSYSSLQTGYQVTANFKAAPSGGSLVGSWNGFLMDDSGIHPIVIIFFATPDFNGSIGDTNIPLVDAVGSFLFGTTRACSH